MNNSKSTKRSLLMSALALVMCLSMFVGSTFAWFTDSVTSSNNIIKSGTLEVAMTYADEVNGKYEDASKGAIFDYKLWEPGYTQVKYVKLKNLGTLALQYKLTVTPNVVNANEKVKLADVIDVYTALVEDGYTAPENFEDAKASMTKVGTLSDVLAATEGCDTGVLLPADGKGSDDVQLPAGTEAYTGDVTVCIALHMQESAGNEYQNLSVGDGFSVQLLATQFTYENDAFNNKYDEKAEYDEVAAKPIAKVEYANDLVNVPTSTFKWNDSFSMVKTGTDVEFQTAYVFKAPVDGEEAAKSPYASWLADFAVSFDKDVTPENGVGIAGEYGDWGWIGFLANNDLFNKLGINKLEANTKYDLLGSFGINMDYEDLCTFVKTFTCSAWADNAKGTTMTVELRLYETEPYDKYNSANVKTGEYVVIGTYTHTFE